ncbi:LYR motif-containing protein 4-like [Liolophura sinensis]|uniref:LYR motif-containing protein 4-like n=1 Tax=Liolophura sinensis TaxID=3198878 RepID=UPI0031595D1F
MSATRQGVLTLYKSLLRESQKFTGYNYRTYALRRTRDAFKEHKSAPPEEVESLLRKAQHNLNVIKRQAAVSQMYGDKPVVVEHQPRAKSQSTHKGMT